MTRSSMLEVMQQDYIRTARAKGVAERMVILKHGLRNAILPVVTYLGTLIANLLTGSFIVERLFAIPGLGKYFVDSITARDYNIIMGVTIFLGVFVVACNLLVDVVYGVIDPRVKRRVTGRILWKKDTRYQPLDKASISADQISPPFRFLLDAWRRFRKDKAGRVRSGDDPHGLPVRHLRADVLPVCV